MKRMDLHRRLSLFNSPADARAGLKARIAGGFYLLNFITGSLTLFFAGHKLTGASNACNLVATVCYVVVTLLFYELFKPANRSVASLRPASASSDALFRSRSPLFPIQSAIWSSSACTA